MMSLLPWCSTNLLYIYVILVDDNRQLECNNLCSIAVFPVTGHVYIADYNNHHVQVFKS